MTYKEYKDARQAEFNELPIFWAFNNEQFKEGMEAHGLTENDTDKIYSFGHGGYYLKTDAPKIRAWVNAPDKLPELMQDFDFCEDAILTELYNHEYAINWQGDWDLFSCFGAVEYSDEKNAGDYMLELGWNDTQTAAFNAAMVAYNKSIDY